MAKKNKKKGVSTAETPAAKTKKAEPVFVEVEGMGKQGVASGKQTFKGAVLVADQHEKPDKAQTLYSDQVGKTVVVEQPKPVLGKYDEDMAATKLHKGLHDTSKPVLQADKLLDKPGVVLVEQSVHDEKYDRVKGKTHELASSGDKQVSDSHAKESKAVDKAEETKEIKENPSTENKDAEVESGSKPEPEPAKGSGPGEPEAAPEP